MNEPSPSVPRSPWAEAYIETVDLHKRLRRVLNRVEDMCCKPEVMTEAERTLTSDYCREMETLNARASAQNAQGGSDG